MSTFAFRFGLSRMLAIMLFAIASLHVSSARADSKGDLDDAIQATKDGFAAAKTSASETKEKLEKALETYKTIKDYVSGAKGTEIIDRLYTSRGIEDHTKLTELRGKLQDVLRALDRAGIESKLEHATKILEQFDTIAGKANDALDFMDRFNPEGARGDPTRGLRLIGSAIEDAASGLPWPMDEIFKEYAQATTSFSKKLDELQQTINKNTRQGSLGGSYASYAEAQEFFEKNFEGKDGRTSTTYLDVSYAFPLLGKSVQVFQDMASDRGEYYVYSLDDARGSLVPRAFEVVYRYFAALPDQTVVPPSNRLGTLLARANSNNLNEQIAEAVSLRQLFETARLNKEAYLRSQGLWDTLGVLLLYGGDTFVGFFLLAPEKHAEIIRIRDALANEPTRVRVLVVDAKDKAPVKAAAVTLGKLTPLRSGGGSAEFDVPPGTFEGSASAPEYSAGGFSVTVAPGGGSEIVRTVELKGKDKDDKEEDEEKPEEDTKFGVVLGAPKVELDPGEKTTVAATVKNGKPPYQFQWTIDGLPMPGRNEPTLPITFAKLGTHGIGVSVKDSSTPPLEAPGHLDLYVGKVNDRDLVGRWTGTGTLLAFEHQMDGFKPEIGKSGPMELRISPDGSGGLVLQNTANAFFCHPAEKAVRSGQSVSIHWDGLSWIPQTQYMATTLKCSLNLGLEAGHLKGTSENTTVTTSTMPGLPAQTGRAHTKSSMDLTKASDSPGPPIGPAPGAAGAPAR